MTELFDSTASTFSPSECGSGPETRRRSRSEKPKRHRGSARQDALSPRRRRQETEPHRNQDVAESKPSNSPESASGAFRRLHIADEPGISAGERRKRLEAIVFKLAETPDFSRRLTSIYERHTMREINAAAALRPDLMPTLNGEFEHFVFFTP